ncbi:ADP-ribose pyrophosphatase YjhB, NUDIX family [Fontimonas thermophila]|uniref:Phosphatase NudJ n=1 Tax=Fontimonas thermophila TaxID=1076937 RepID=A0A1I2HR70_9GAMM|nr:NUDIX hydrolase [Fontimonas thermophila]SFF32379.1 ADP-ribose pyrophosphatase YjhB, NUDIX family [Fontimonas thermophila]
MNWSPHVVVACIVEREGRFLVVEEEVSGRVLLNQPAGHWEQHETLIAAARRETLEETRWEVEPLAVLGLYHFDPPDLDYGFLRIAFVARALRERPELTLDSGILRPLWLTRAELLASCERHRSPMVLRCVDDYLAGRRYPLDLIAHL